MGRRSNEQICIDLRKERGNLYNKRRRLVLKRKGLTKKQNAVIDKKYSSIQKRLDEVRENLFRCGKKYSKFKKQRRKLMRHQYYLQGKIRDIREKMSVSGITKKETRSLKKRLNIIGTYERKTLDDIHLVEKSMKLPIGTVTSGSGIIKGVVSLKSGKFVDQNIIWRLAEDWQKWLDSGYFDTLVLDDEIYDMDENPMIATAAIYQAYDWAIAWQHIYGSPFYFVYGDAKNGYLEIKVKEYTTDMYEAEIAAHGGDIAT